MNKWCGAPKPEPAVFSLTPAHPHTLTHQHPHTLTRQHPDILTPSHPHTLTPSGDRSEVRRELLYNNVVPIDRKVDVRLPGERNSNSYGARPIHLIITMMKWNRTSRLSIKNYLSFPSTPNHCTLNPFQEIGEKFTQAVNGVAHTPTLPHSHTPTLPHSHTPTLPHSHTPTLPHSLSPTRIPYRALG